MKYNQKHTDLNLTLSNVISLLTKEQKIALEWKYELSDLSALAKMLPSMAASARLGLTPNTIALGFCCYALFLAQVNANRPTFKQMVSGPALTSTLELKAELPKPQPYLYTPTLQPGY